MATTHQKLHSITVFASAAISTRRFIDRNGSHALPSGTIIGVSEQTVAVGKAFSVITQYSAPVEAAEAIAEGASIGVASDGTGRAVNGYGAGWAKSAAVAAGDVLEVVIGGPASMPAADSRQRTYVLFAASGAKAAPLGGTINNLTFGKIGLPAPGVIEIPPGMVPASVAAGIGYAVLEVVGSFKRTGTQKTNTVTVWLGPTNSPQDTTLANPSMDASDGQTAKFTWHAWLSGNTVDSHCTGWKDGSGGTSAEATGGAWDINGSNFVTVGSNDIGVNDTLGCTGLVVLLHVNSAGGALYNMVDSPIYVPPEFFCICSQDWPWNGATVGTPPTFPFGRLSNYDNKATHWNRLHQSANTINWTNLDTWVTNAKAFGVLKGLYVLYGTPQFLASSGGAVQAPYGGPGILCGGGAYPAFNDASLSQLTYFCTQFALRNKTVWGGFFDRVSLWNEPDFTQNPGSSKFWWGTRPQFVDTLYTAFAALKAADSTLIVMSPGTFSVIDANTGLNQWLNQAGTLNPTKRGYDTYEEFAAHDYHCRPFGYSGNGDILGLQLGGILAVRAAQRNTPRANADYGVSEYGIASGAGPELTKFLAETQAWREAFIQRLWIDAILCKVTFKTAFSLGNVDNLMGNLSTDDPGAISALRKLYNACAGKTIVAPSGIMPDGSRFLTFADGSTYQA